MSSWTSETARSAGRITRRAVIGWIASNLICAGCVFPPTAGKPGAGKGTPAQPAGPRPQHIYIGADTSGSMTVTKRGAAFGMVYLLCDQVLRRAPVFTIFAYDESVRLLLDNPVKNSSELQSVEDEICGGGPGMKSTATGQETKRRTHPARLLKHILKRITAEPPHTEEILVLLTDGEDAEPAETRAVVQELAKRQGIRAVWVIGVAVGQELRAYRGADLYSQVRETYAPFGDRLVVSSRLDLAAGPNEIARVLGGG
jgi:uncharacterized protein with von Willebrand factor type A (vWA) domain